MCTAPTSKTWVAQLNQINLAQETIVFYSAINQTRRVPLWGGVVGMKRRKREKLFQRPKVDLRCQRFLRPVNRRQNIEIQSNTAFGAAMSEYKRHGHCTRYGFFLARQRRRSTPYQ